MSTDKELLEWAAKAIVHPDDFANQHYMRGMLSAWNPLTDDGDALRLVVKLNLLIMPYPIDGAVRVTRLDQPDTIEHYGDDPYAATRRAVVRAAAEIGKEKNA